VFMARGPRILVIDDDRAMRTLLRREFTAAGYRVQDATLDPASFASLVKRPIDLLILDIDSPSCGGLDAIDAVRDLTKVPILAVSACADEGVTVAALRKGADDVIRTPFHIGELLARAENALRRREREKGKPAPLVTGDLEVDLLHRRVRARGREVRLGPKAYQVLTLLAEHAGQVLTYQDMLRAVWGDARAGRLEYLRVVIRDLRRKLEANPRRPRYILTENRVGYRLEVQRRIRDAANAAAAKPLKGTIDRLYKH
jgi:two-component system, OmpR family, KDP operon response regulator KdpE